MKSKNLSFLILFTTIFLQSTIHAQWRTEPLPDARIQSFGAASEDRLFLPGGLENDFLGDVAVYDIDSKSWSSMPLSEPRTMIEAVVSGNLLFCAGGIHFGTNEKFSTIEVYDVNTLEFLGQSELSVPRIALSAVAVGDKLLFAGGASPDIQGPDLLGFEVHATVDIFDFATETWSVAQLSDARAGMASAVLGDKAYFAGGDKGNGVVSDVVDIYDASTDTWTTDKLSVGRAFYGGGVAFDDKVYFAGGTLASSENTAVIDVFDPSTETWSMAQLSTPRAGVRAGTTEGNLLFAGGASVSNLAGWMIDNTSNIVDIYNLEADEWTIFRMENDRASHMVLSAKNQVFVIGGLDFTNGGILVPDMVVFRGKKLDFEARVTDISEDYEFTIVGPNHIKDPFIVSYEFQNSGAMALENINVQFEVLLNGAVIHRDSASLSLTENEGIEQVTFSYLPEEIGLHEFRTTANQKDIGAIFFEDIQTLEVSTTTLAKDDGSVESGISFSFLSPEDFGYFGTEYELLSSETVSAVSFITIPFEGFSVAEAEFNFIIKAIDENGNAVEGELYKSEPIIAGETFREDLSFYTYELTAPIVLEPGKYIFAFGQDSLGLQYALGADSDHSDAQNWEYNSLESDIWRNVPKAYTLIIRPHFLEEITQPLNNWVSTPGEGPPIANSLSAVDENTAWYLVSDFGVNAVMRTIDGGATISLHEFPDSDTQLPFVIFAQNENTAYLGTVGLSGASALALRTKDGGNTWEPLNFGKEVLVSAVVGIHFYDEQEGFLIVNDLTGMRFFKTTDGGDNWIENESIPTQQGDIQFMYNTNSIYDVKDNYIWIGTLSGKILRSKDRGATWEALEWVSDDATSVAFRDTLHGIVVNTGSITGEGINGEPTRRTGYRTSDGGNTWEEIQIPNDLETVEYIPGSGGVYIGTEGFTIKPYYYITKDNGDNWEELPSDFILDTDFLDNSTGWATNGFGLAKWEGGILEATDFVEVVHAVPYLEDFDNGLPAQYEIGGNFQLSSSPFRQEEYAGLGVVKDSDFAGVTSINPWWTYTTVETAAIQLPTDFTTELSFEAFFQNRDTEANERAVVAISVDGKQTWTELYDLEENAAVDWKVHTASLEAYQGQKIHLAFNYEDPSVGGAFGFFIDNIVLSQAMVTSTEDDLSTKVSLKVFPNPSTNQLFIDLDYDREQTTHLQLFDVTGRRLIDKIVNHHQLIQEDISAFPEGMYWLRLTSGAYQRTVKVAKY